MPLLLGSRVGPYEILAPLGAGGMGEVYRARDARLAREVAVKVLPAALVTDADRLRRFEIEARAAARLNHPSILHVYDVGQHDGQPYLVTELLEGESLRDRLHAGPFAMRSAIEFAIPIAYGLAAAHEQGIVHRDLKPENLFLTRDGRAKILDFGLAKLTRPDEAETHLTNAPTTAGDTGAGTVLGTVGYMSPEQVRGQVVDPRSDLFSFGSILYEMLSGRRAFQGASPVETMSAILKEQPPDLTLSNQEIPRALERVVRHCLEKSPEGRFHSAHDLAFQLEGVRDASDSGSLRALTDTIGKAPSLPSYRRMTHRRGFVSSARFASDGKTVFYSASWDGEPFGVFMRRPESPEAIPLALPSGSTFLSVMPSGELAIQLHPHIVHNGVHRGTLALAPFHGGAPREVAEDVNHAEGGAEDDAMLIVRDVGGVGRIEFPIDHVLHESPGHASYPRLSPDGDRIAFLDHPFAQDDRGAVALLDLEGKKVTLTPQFTSIQGLAWAPSGKDIWFTAAETGSGRSLYAVRPTGEMRRVANFPGGVRLMDIAKDGRVLLSRDSIRCGILAKGPGQSVEREMGWLDWSIPAELSPDGRMLLFDEESEDVGEDYVVCIRKTDGSQVVRLGDGMAKTISPDGRWVLARLPRPGSPVVLMPTGPGRKRTFETDGVELSRARWLPDGRQIFWFGRNAQRRSVAFLLDVERGVSTPLPFDREDRPDGWAIAPDGRWAVLSFDETTEIVPLHGGTPGPGPRLEPGEHVVAVSPDGQWIVVANEKDTEIEVSRVHIESGKREPWRKLAPTDLGGVSRIGHALFSADGEAYAYFYARVLSDLYVAEGLE